MFITYDSQNEDSQLEILDALFEQPGMKMYDFLAIGLNTHVFHVDISVKDEERYQRILFYQIEDVLKFYKAFDFFWFKISIQSKRKNYENYSIKPVCAVLKGRTAAGQDAYVFECSDGTHLVNDFFEGTVEQILGQDYVWREEALDTNINE